jgi:hypothetical protein
MTRVRTDLNMLDLENLSGALDQLTVSEKI